jgi:hypothetical protein
MNKLTAMCISCGLVLLPFTTVYAYVGPGAGLSLLGALWALILAVATAIIFVFAWPIRRMLRRKREAEELRATAEYNRPDITRPKPSSTREDNITISRSRR